MKQARPTCQIPAHPSSCFTQQSAKNTGDDNNSVSGSNPGSFIVMMQIPKLPTDDAYIQLNIVPRVPKLSGEH